MFSNLVVVGLADVDVFWSLWLQRLWVWMFFGAGGCGCRCILGLVVLEVVGVDVFWS